MDETHSYNGEHMHYIDNGTGQPFCGTFDDGPCDCLRKLLDSTRPEHGLPPLTDAQFEQVAKRRYPKMMVAVGRLGKAA